MGPLSPPHVVWDALVHPRPVVAHYVVRDVRVPRTVAALLVGAATGLSGALRNFNAATSSPAPLNA